MMTACVACPQNLIFRFLQSRQKVQIWLYEQTDLRIEGRIIVSFGSITHIVLPANPGVNLLASRPAPLQVGHVSHVLSATLSIEYYWTPDLHSATLCVQQSTVHLTQPLLHRHCMRWQSQQNAADLSAGV